MARKKQESSLDKAKWIAGWVCLGIAVAVVVGLYLRDFVRERTGADRKPLPEKGSIVTVKGQTQLRGIRGEKSEEGKSEK